MTTIVEARDAIMGLLRTAWLLAAATQDVLLLWDNAPGDKPAADSFGNVLPYARASVRHNVGDQETMGARGNRRYLSGGAFTVQVFTPIGDGHTLGDAIVEVVKDAIRQVAPSLGVWFYTVRVSEIGTDGPWFQTNVDATFRYQERA